MSLSKYDLSISAFQKTMESRGANTGASNLWDGLMFAMPMVEGVGNPYDFSGYARHAKRYGSSGANPLPQWETISGEARIPSPYAMGLDGTDDYLVTSKNHDITGSQSRTTSLWFKTTNPVKQSFLHMGDGNNTKDYEIQTETGNDDIRVAVSGGNRKFSYTGYTDGKWHHLVTTFEGTTTADIEMYIDGVQLAQASLNSANVNTANSAINISRDPNLPGQYVTGSLSSIYIWGRKLAESEIEQLYNDGGAMWRLRSTNVFFPAINVLTTEEVLTNTFAIQLSKKNNKSVGIYQKAMEASGSNVKAQNLWDGLVLAMPMIEGAGNPRDFSGWGNHGTRNGSGGANNLPQWVRHDNDLIPFQYCLDFDGDDDYVDFGAPASLMDFTAKTVSAWVRTHVKFDVVTNRVLLGFGYWGTNNGDMLYGAFSGHLYFYVQNSSGTLAYGELVNDCPINTWYHVAYSWDGSNVRYYVNGDELADVDSLTGTLSCDGGHHIGANTYHSKEFNGEVADVFVWRRGLSASEIQQLYYDGAAMWRPRSVNVFFPSINVATEAQTVSVIRTSKKDDVDTGVFQKIMEFRGVYTEAPNLWDGLVFAMPMIEGAGNPYDFSGWSNHGTREGATGSNNLPQWETHTEVLIPSPYCLDFDVTDDRVELGDKAIGNLLHGCSGSTISIWFYKQTYFYGNKWAFEAYVDGAKNAIAIRTQTPPKLDGGGRSTTTDGFQQKYGNTLLSLNTWYHFVTVLDYTGDKIKLYLNGKQDNIGNDSVTFLSDTFTLGTPSYDDVIGGVNARNRHFDGKISNVYVWNRVLMDTEIEQLYYDGTAMWRPKKSVSFFQFPVSQLLFLNRGLLSGGNLTMTNNKILTGGSL